MRVGGKALAKEKKRQTAAELNVVDSGFHEHG